jgi:hypothetical protein
MGEAFATVTANCFHYWRPVTDVPCLIWAETGEENPFYANNRKEEQNIAGTVDLFTKTEFDPLVDEVQETLEGLGVTWSLNAVAYEDETKMIHYTWDWGVAFGG